MMYQKTTRETAVPVLQGNRMGRSTGAVSPLVPQRRKRSVVQGGMFNHNRRVYRSI